MVVKDRFSRTAGKAIINNEPSLTQQQFAEECDINVITARYLKQGLPPPVLSNPIWDDFTAVDFQDMQNKVLEAKSAFAALPAKVRRRFQESEYLLLKFLEDPDNYDEAVKLGLIEKKEEKPSAPNPAQQVIPLPDPEANPHKKPGEPAAAP